MTEQERRQWAVAETRRQLAEVKTLERGIAAISERIQRKVTTIRILKQIAEGK